jgi:hypothetical protein
VTVRPARTSSPPDLQDRTERVDHLVMNTIACSAVARAGLCAATASLDHEAAWPLLQVAGWLTTAADLMVEAGLREAALGVT